MAPRQARASVQRDTRFEKLEARRVMSAQSLGDFHVEYLNEVGVETGAIGDSFSNSDLNQLLSDAHAQTGLTAVQSLYGFTGSGQTVAVIDTGIAYDHIALGGGLGAGYQVVGGWDFSEENDADPYDDGFSGSHGTHVAGIIGSNDATHAGVAPDVDLVALRVFNDFGAGYFEWVEDALQWVHDNRNAFENPITTVNLSLGGTWNSDALPEWAILEDEFAQLEQDGIFISVAAGNSFASYGEPGLSYPAASPHVVPVSSVDLDGSLSYYSQRHERVLAAPGAGIISTIPDYKGNNNGIADDFVSYSGTSMASPYVAGASVLVRQAMEFMGHENITQETIYNHLRDTADQVYDGATGATYHSINLEAAIDALIPADDYGSTAATAHSLGTLSGNSTLTGLVGTTTDTDYFTFKAGETGQLRFTFATTHELSLQGEIVQGSGVSQDNTLSLDVVAGQTYVIAVGTTSGIGFYNADVELKVAESDADAGDSGADSGGSGTGAGAGNDTGNDTGGSDTGGGSAGNDAKDDDGGQSSSDEIAQAAYDLDQAKQLSYTGSDHLNWGGSNGKWLQGNDGWYFILSDGEVYHWSGSGGATGDQVATLDASYYNDLSKLYDAQPPSDNGNTDSGDSDSGNSDSDDTGSDEANSGGGATDDTDSGSDGGDATDDGSDGNGGNSDAESDNLARARELDDQYRFSSNGTYYEDWAGLGEKWIQSETLGWVFITPDGKVHDWSGSQANAGDSPLIAELDATFHADPSLLTDPPADTGSDSGQEDDGQQDGGQQDDDTGDGGQQDGEDDQQDGDTGEGQDQGETDSVARRAYDLDQQLGLGTRGSYYTNWAGTGEKWVTSTSGQWYFIRSDGDLYRWNGSQSNINASTLIATLDATYYADPSKLHDATPPASGSDVDTVQATFDSTARSATAATTAAQLYDNTFTSATAGSHVRAHFTAGGADADRLPASLGHAQSQSYWISARHTLTNVFVAGIDTNHGRLEDTAPPNALSHTEDWTRETEAVDTVFDALEESSMIADPTGP